MVASWAEEAAAGEVFITAGGAERLLRVGVKPIDRLSSAPASHVANALSDHLMPPTVADSFQRPMAASDDADAGFAGARRRGRGSRRVLRAAPDDVGALFSELDLSLQGQAPCS